MNNSVHRVRIPENMTVSEAYKALRANIQFRVQSKNIKTLAVTSYSPNEGKTTTSINLAASLAQIGMRVLYVDADLRKPLLFKEIGIEDFNFNGLSNILMKQIEISEAVRETNFSGLYTITCGIKPSNPAELISSNEMAEFLQQVKQQYDIVIIDTPPLGSVIDSAVIASQTDGVLIVIASNKVRCQNAQRVKEQLEKAGACILGAVLNKVNRSDYKYYYGGYDYYGKHKKSSRQWINIIKNTRGNRHG